jgi:glycolate oxidase
MMNNRYRKLDSTTIKLLQGIVGDNFVLTDKEKLEPFSHDEVSDSAYASMPEVVIKPRTANEISLVMRLANERRFPVTPRGAGSGLSGGAVPVYGGVVLSFERMNEILEVDEQNMMVVVEPGVVTNDINKKVKDLGLFFAGYPMSLETCFIGGNVAENAGGGKAVKYGVTERYILGLEFVTPTGEIVTTGGKRIKDVTGYNLRAFLVGSEGTLGIITKVILKLLPLPKVKADLFVLFPDIPSAIGIVPRIMSELGIVPTAIEFMDYISFHYACLYLNEKINYENSAAMLLIEVDGGSDAEVEEEYDAIGNLCMKNGAQEVYIADNYTTQERLWNIRRNFGEALILYSKRRSFEDVVVPIAAIPQLAEEIERISGKYDVLIMIHGHAGDGNIHSNILMRDHDTEDNFDRKLPDVQVELYRSVIALGGTISGEHGIGHKRKKFMHLVMSDAEIDFMRKIKQAVDPNYVLNPGKIFDIN